MRWIQNLSQNFHVPIHSLQMSTIIGPGNLSTAPTGEGADEAVRLREGTAGNFWNHLVTNVYKVGVAIKDSSAAYLQRFFSLVS